MVRGADFGVEAALGDDGFAVVGGEGLAGGHDPLAPRNLCHIPVTHPYWRARPAFTTSLQKQPANVLECLQSEA